MLAGLLTKCSSRTALGGPIWRKLYNNHLFTLDQKHKRAYAYGREVYEYEMLRRGVTGMDVQVDPPLQPKSLVPSLALLGFCGGLASSHGHNWYWHQYLERLKSGEYRALKQTPSYIYGTECMVYEAVRRGGDEVVRHLGGIQIPRW